MKLKDLLPKNELIKATQTPNDFSHHKPLTELKSNMEIYKQPTKPLYIAKQLPPDHIGIWQKTQLRRKESSGHLILGGNYRHWERF